MVKTKDEALVERIRELIETEASYDRAAGKWRGTDDVARKIAAVLFDERDVIRVREAALVDAVDSAITITVWLMRCVERKDWREVQRWYEDETLEGHLNTLREAIEDAPERAKAAAEVLNRALSYGLTPSGDNLDALSVFIDDWIDVNLEEDSTDGC